MNQVHPRRARNDFLQGVAFCAFGLYMAVEGFGMPGAGGFIEAGGEPGRVPVMLGIIIGTLGATLMARSARAALTWLRQRPPREVDDSINPRVALMTAAGCTLYGVVLIGLQIGGWKVPFSLGTALFVFAFIVIAEWNMPERRAGRLPRWVSAAMFAVAISIAVSFVFERWFFVTLP